MLSDEDLKMMHYKHETIYDAGKKVWRGIDVHPLFNPEMSVGQALLHMLNLNPDKVVQIVDSTNQKLTAREMRLLSIRAAQNLRLLGYEQDDVIGIMASNTHFVAPLAFGAFLNGIPISTLDPSFDKGEIKHMFAITKPRAIFCDDLVYEAIKQTLNELNCKCPIYLMKGSVKGVPSVEEIFRETGKENLFVPEKLKKGGDAIAAILCSSGTTGLPKGVCMSHRSLLKQCESNLSVDEVLFCFSTLYWLTGLVIMIIGTLCNGTRILTDEPFSPELLLRLIEKHKITMLLTPPSQMAMAVQCPDIKFRDLSSVRRYLCGGSAVPVVVANEMQKYLKHGHVIVGYGMSEISGLVTGDYPGFRQPGAVGKIAAGMQVKIISDDGKQLGIGESGEIYLKPIYKCLGYYRNPQSTKDTFDSDGWVHSGDIGYFDNDGYLFIVDRKKDILKYKNFHYFPTEIEAVINEIPDVVEVCVFGLPDIVATDLPAAAVVKSEDSPLTKDDVSNYVAKRMSHFKHLRGGVYFVKSLPKTASGKVQRRKVKEIFSQCQETEEVLDK